jgi:hypothetical protein
MSRRGKYQYQPFWGQESAGAAAGASTQARDADRLVFLVYPKQVRDC